MIKFEDVGKVYFGQKKALQNINFHIPKQSLTYLIGHSGAGKSTLLKLIMGMERANGGKILFNNHDITRIPYNKLPFLRRKIGMVHQEDLLLDNKTVLENVALPLIIDGYSPVEANVRAMSALTKVSLYNYENFYPVSLSGGERQRVGIARAIVHNPEILLADEPTGNLDHNLAMEIFQLFSQLNQQGMTVLIATHDLSALSDDNSNYLTLKHGRLV